MLAALLLFCCATLASAQTLGIGAVPPNTACTNSGQCYQDPLNCSFSVCRNGVCTASVRPTLLNCFDGRNQTNWDYCELGACVGANYTNLWININTTLVNINAVLADSYNIVLQTAIVQYLGLTNAQSPAVRTCFENSQVLTGAALTNADNITQVFARACSPRYVIVSNGPTAGTGSLQMWVQLVQGPTLTNGTITALANTLVNGINSGAFLSQFGLQIAAVGDSPFDPLTYIPWINGPLLGIAIGIACGLFLISVLGCVIFYSAKSRREVYGNVLTTDSTASMQSGSSMRSESHASATE